MTGARRSHAISREHGQDAGPGTPGNALASLKVIRQ